MCSFDFHQENKHSEIFIGYLIPFLLKNRLNRLRPYILHGEVVHPVDLPLICDIFCAVMISVVCLVSSKDNLWVCTSPFVYREWAILAYEFISLYPHEFDMV